MSDKVLVGNAAYTLGVLVVAEMVRWVIKRGINTTLVRLGGKRGRTAGSLLKNLAKFVIWGMAVMTILSRWGVNISPLLAGAGIAGAAVAFGSQKLVSDMVSGLFMILENQVAVGDVVEVVGKKGKVAAIKLRTLVIRNDKEGVTYIIPNSVVGVVTKIDVAD